MITTRFCQRCATEVEDTGGYCLLGHRLSLDAPVASLEELRAEVDRSFEEARLEVEALVSSTLGAAAPTVSEEEVTAPLSAPLFGRGPVSLAAPDTAERAPRTASAPAPPSAPARSLPPPPPPPRAPQRAQVWKELEEDVDLEGDPIVAFAPPPRIDWGPEKSTRLRRKPSRLARRKNDV